MPKPKTPQIVTKERLAKSIEQRPEFTIGRALVALFNRQTSEEMNGNTTRFLNGVGFSSNDARLGCIGAKYFIKHGTLTESLMKGWLRKDKNGLPRIAKYARQLNSIAINKLNNKTNHGIQTHKKSNSNI